MKRIYTILAILVLCAATTPVFGGIELGPLTIGGAMRVNYINGDYSRSANTAGTNAPYRGGSGGNFKLDVFRLNLDFAQANWLGKAEYRWYDGYNFLHTGWVGYQSEQIGHLEVGLNRVPFGVGPFGPANSWFFDQHYYMGLSDHMKLGAKLTRSFGNLTLDGGYFIRNMFNGRGSTSHSSRYSYAVVDEDVHEIPGAYRETHQLNARAIYSIEKLKTDLGVSAQWTRLDARDHRASNSDAWAVSAHSSSTFGPVGVKLQLTSFDYNPKYRMAAGGTQPPNSLVNMGAYDFGWPAASKGVIPSIALSYTITDPLPWIDTITFYNDYSVIMKKGSYNGHNLKNSALNVTGMSVARGNWLIYVDYAVSNGNYFVGNKHDDYRDTYLDSAVGDFGANRNHKWKSRFNINFGYYF